MKNLNELYQELEINKMSKKELKVAIKTTERFIRYFTNTLNLDATHSIQIQHLNEIKFKLISLLSK